ncbi:hypothetical protein TrVE_jg8200 [Triparma verrucosa]|uniref:Pectin acetylesterase n=2 Tax=Triparma TaxID=722752 RepID=A0A9W7F1K6_9STRA|nr:hypothetical protein TrST_g13602 [Triparma strigata]GMI05040.1 hypothetical protein TrVE_jg8200 [Triparma verrucosa]
MNLLLLLPLCFGLASSASPTNPYPSFTASELDQIESTAVTLLKSWSTHPSFTSPAITTEGYGVPMTKTPVPESFSDSTMCLDGSPFYFYIRPGDPTKVALFLQGGGLCIERFDCEHRATTNQGSSNEWEEEIYDERNVLSQDPRSPLSNYTHVFMRYCSGDTWTGTNTVASGPGRYDLYFSGHNQVAAALSHLQATLDFGSTPDSQFFLSGASAGGIGTNNNCDFVASTLGPNVSVKCSPQAGLFFPEDTVALWQSRIGVNGMTTNQIASIYLSRMFSSHHDTSCVVHAVKNLDPPSYCWEGSYLTPHISTPILVAQNFWDQLQIDNILCFQDNLKHASCTKDFLVDFKTHTLEQLTDLSGKQRLGLFAPSCYMHTGNLCLFNTEDDGENTVVAGKTYLDAVKSFVEDDELMVVVDDCVGEEGDEDYVPCSKVCEMHCG